MLKRSIAIFVLCAAMPAWGRPLTIGTVREAPADAVRELLPFADYLARHLTPHGIDEGAVLVATGISEMASHMLRARIDVCIAEPFTALAVSLLTDAELALQAGKGTAENPSVIVARTDSGIRGLSDLRGRMVAFDQPLSSPGHLLPKLALLRRGARVVPRPQPSDIVRPDEVGYVFTQDPESSIVWVLRGKVAAAALGLEQYRRYSRQSQKKLRIVHETFSLPHLVVMMRPGLPEPLVSTLGTAMLAMDDDEEGKRILEGFDGVTSFGEIPQDVRSLLVGTESFVRNEFGL
jgi:phosphonate transport system substrate-binding protein